MVEATVNGRLELVKLRIDKSQKVDPADTEMLEDLIVAAVRAAQAKAAEMTRARCRRAPATWGCRRGCWGGCEGEGETGDRETGRPGDRETRPLPRPSSPTLLFSHSPTPPPSPSRLHVAGFTLVMMYTPSW